MKLTILNLRKQPAPDRQKNYSKDILDWGENNTKPVEIINTINGSITGGACINTLRRYVYGSGLNVDPEAKVGKNTTAFHLHRQLSSQIVKLRGVAIHVRYTPEFKMSLKKIPFESCRLSIPDDLGNISHIMYNPYFGLPDYKEEQTIKYHDYNPDPKIITKQVEEAGGWPSYKGQVYWKAINSEFNEFYPLPEWFGDNFGKGGGKKWMEIEKSIGDFHAHNIDKGFLQNVLMKIVGDPDEPIAEHRQKATNGERYTSIGNKFKEYMQNEFAGAEGDKMLVMWSKIKEEFPSLEAFPSSTNHDLFQTLQRLSTENILIATQVPPVLAGVKVSGTLSKDDIVNAVKMMWGNVEDEQQFLEEVYNELFPKLVEPLTDVKITNYSPISMGVDDKIWETLTLEEKREWVKQNTEVLDGLQESINNQE